MRNSEENLTIINWSWKINDCILLKLIKLRKNAVSELLDSNKSVCACAE